MKEGDIVKIRKMSKKHKWNTAFGVLFTGLSGELTGIVNHHDQTQSYFVRFKASEYDNLLVIFFKEELKLITEYPICKNITEPKRKPTKGE